MSKVLAVIMLSGASCVSPVETSDVLRVTMASKVPCAIVIRDPITNPFKVAQEPNTITPAAAKPAPAFKYPPKKKAKKKRRARR